MADTLHYFAYGSNLHPLRLGERIESARSVGVARLAGHELRFHKRGADGSGKCNAWFTGSPAAQILGALYTLDAGHKARLDAIEGAGYRAEAVRVAVDGQSVEAFTYLAEPGWVDEAQKPYHWYKALVAEGARYRGFEPALLGAIEAVACVDDRDAMRRQDREGLLARMRRYRSPPAR